MGWNLSTFFCGCRSFFSEPAFWFFRSSRIAEKGEPKENRFFAGQSAGNHFAFQPLPNHYPVFDQLFLDLPGWAIAAANVDLLQQAAISMVPNGAGVVLGICGYHGYTGAGSSHSHCGKRIGQQENHPVWNGHVVTWILPVCRQK